MNAATFSDNAGAQHGPASASSAFQRGGGRNGTTQVRPPSDHRGGTEDPGLTGSARGPSLLDDADVGGRTTPLAPQEISRLAVAMMTTTATSTMPMAVEEEDRQDDEDDDGTRMEDDDDAAPPAPTPPLKQKRPTVNDSSGSGALSPKPDARCRDGDAHYTPGAVTGLATAGHRDRTRQDKSHDDGRLHEDLDDGAKTLPGAH